MHIGIIDNGSRHTPLLKTMLGQHNRISMYAPSQSSTLPEADIDLFILSGSYIRPYYDSIYYSEIELIKRVTKPILGICEGYELIAHTYGSEIKKLEYKRTGVRRLDILNEKSELVRGIDNLTVYEAHRFAIAKVPDEFEAIAESESGIEIMKHKTKKVFGFQFHPEVTTEHNTGKEVLMNLIYSL